MHLQEKTIDSKEIYNGKIIKVYSDTVELENGSTAPRELVVHSGGVCVVPLTEDMQIYLVKQFRYPFKTALLEVPAGKVEIGEIRPAAILRELKEEIGATCRTLECLGKCYPTVAYDSEIIDIYMATGLEFDGQKLDEGEFLDVVKMPLEKAVEMIMNGEIRDAKTQIAILKADKIVSGYYGKFEYNLNV